MHVFWFYIIVCLHVVTTFSAYMQCEQVHCVCVMIHLIRVRVLVPIICDYSGLSLSERLLSFLLLPFLCH